jgi:hypothetical protein
MLSADEMVPRLSHLQAEIESDITFDASGN